MSTSQEKSEDDDYSSELNEEFTNLKNTIIMLITTQTPEKAAEIIGLLFMRIYQNKIQPLQTLLNLLLYQKVSAIENEGEISPDTQSAEISHDSV